MLPAPRCAAPAALAPAAAAAAGAWGLRPLMLAVTMCPKRSNVKTAEASLPLMLSVASAAEQEEQEEVEGFIHHPTALRLWAEPRFPSMRQRLWQQTTMQHAARRCSSKGSAPEVSLTGRQCSTWLGSSAGGNSGATAWDSVCKRQQPFSSGN